LATSRYGLEIRAAAASEVAGLAELLAQAGIIASSRMLADRLEAITAATGTTLVALEWGPPSGVVVVHWYRNLLADAPVAQIGLLLVAHEARRRGIGRLLIKAAAQAARVAGCGELEILVHGQHPELAQFCAATGFEALGTSFRRKLRKT